MSVYPVEDRSHSEPAEYATMEVRLQVATALAQASTKALLNLSPLAHREINQALANEASILELRADGASISAAFVVRTLIAA
jgi:hypothetical protein